jgi:hypothetical protein
VPQLREVAAKRGSLLRHVHHQDRYRPPSLFRNLPGPG